MIILSFLLIPANNGLSIRIWSSGYVCKSLIIVSRLSKVLFCDSSHSYIENSLFPIYFSI